MNIRFPVVFTLMLTGVLAVSMGCSSGSQVSTPPSVEFHHDAGGNINHGESLVFSASGLNPGEFPVLAELFSSTGIKVAQARLTADRNGRINNVVLAYDVGLASSAGMGKIPPGTYNFKMSVSAGIVESTITIPDQPTSSVVLACDIDGDLSNAFTAGDPVFVRATGLTPGVTYRIWPVVDRRSWNNGDIIKSWHADAPLAIWPPEILEYIEVEADVDGEIDPTQLLPYATKMIPGMTDQFDVVLDAEPYGVFNVSTDAVDGQIPTGVVVQDPHGDGPIYTELASKSDYTYTNSFKVGDSISVWLNPGVILDEFSPFIYKYIFLHLADLQDGMTIEDITEGVDMDMIQEGCVNEGLILAWILAQLGEYDVLLDINANGVYDEGIDVLDGGPSGPGFVVTE